MKLETVPTGEPLHPRAHWLTDLPSSQIYLPPMVPLLTPRAAQL